MKNKLNVHLEYICYMEKKNYLNICINQELVAKDQVVLVCFR